MTSPRPVLIVPGLSNSGPDHWQSYWHKRLDGAVWVDQIDWNLPRLGDWVASLVQAIREHPGAILIGHSLGCALIAHVAQLRGNRGMAARCWSPPPTSTATARPACCCTASRRCRSSA